MNTLTLVNFLLVKLFPTLIRQNFPLSKICAIPVSLQPSCTLPYQKPLLYYEQGPSTLYSHASTIRHQPKQSAFSFHLLQLKFQDAHSNKPNVVALGL